MAAKSGLRKTEKFASPKRKATAEKKSKKKAAGKPDKGIKVFTKNIFRDRSHSCTLLVRGSNHES